MNLDRIKEKLDSMNKVRKEGKEKRRQKGEEFAQKIINKLRKEKVNKEKAVAVRAEVTNRNGDITETTCVIH